MSAKNAISYTVETTMAVPDTVNAVTSELKKRGYGVLSNIDVRKIIKEKLGEEMTNYVILDICNPGHAKTALDAHKELGLILPCKITVYQESTKTLVSLFRPTEAIKVTGFEDLQPLAREVEHQLKEAVDAVAA